MDLFINIFIIVCGFIGTIVAIGGKTCLETDDPILKRITTRGWIGLVCLVASFTVGIVKESRSAASSEKSARQSIALSNELATARARLEESREYLRYMVYAEPVPEGFSDEILERMQKLAVANNLPPPGSTVTEDGSIAFDFTESDKQIGFLVLSKVDMGDLALLPKNERDKALSGFMFGRWGTDNVKTDWKTISNRIKLVASKILYPRFSAAGITSDSNAGNTTMSFFPIDENDVQISSNKLTLDIPALQAILKLPPWKRGAQIVEMSEHLD